MLPRENVSQAALWMFGFTVPFLFAVAERARADSLLVDFGTPQSSDYSVTVLDGNGSSWTAAAVAGRFEVVGNVASGSEPKVVLTPQVSLRAGDDWSVEARFRIDNALLASMATRDSLQTWITVGNALDGDDDVRSKSGLLKGVFSVGPLQVSDGYFVSSGWFIDGDSSEATPDPDAYSFIDPAAAGATQSVETTLRIEYDATAAEVTTLYKIGSGAFTPYPVTDENGMPALPLDPVVDWFTGTGGALDVHVLIAATKAAAQSGESSAVAGNFSLASGELWLDDLEIVGTFLPEPGSSALGAVAVLVAAIASRLRLRR